MSRAPVGKSRPGSTGEDGGHPLAAKADAPVAECENAAVQLQQPSSLDPILNQPLVEAEGGELPPSDYPVLPFGKPTNRGRRRIAGRNALSMR
jgi:hypothetical protein